MREAHFSFEMKTINSSGPYRTRFMIDTKLWTIQNIDIGGYERVEQKIFIRGYYGRYRINKWLDIGHHFSMMILRWVNNTKTKMTKSTWNFMMIFIFIFVQENTCECLGKGNRRNEPRPWWRCSLFLNVIPNLFYWILFLFVGFSPAVEIFVLNIPLDLAKGCIRLGFYYLIKIISIGV